MHGVLQPQQQQKEKFLKNSSKQRKTAQSTAGATTATEKKAHFKVFGEWRNPLKTREAVARAYVPETSTFKVTSVLSSRWLNDTHDHEHLTNSTRSSTELNMTFLGFSSLILHLRFFQRWKPVSVTAVQDLVRGILLKHIYCQFEGCCGSSRQRGCCN